MRIKFGTKDIEVSVNRVGSFGKFRGLMFHSKKVGNLMFEFSRERRWGIHSLFVFFSFLAVWLDGENRVLEWKIVRPFRFSVRPRKKFRRLIEIPLSEENRGLVGEITGKV